LRILHVAYIYPPELRVADGITNVVFNITKELAKRGHKVTVYTSNLCNLHGYELLSSGHHLINGVDVFHFGSLLKYKTFIFTPSVVESLIRNADRFDLIHIHDARSFQGISAYFLGKIKKVPYVYHPHGSYKTLLSEPISLKISKLVLDGLVSSRIFKNALKVIALSGVEAEQYKRMGVSEEKIAIIPNGIDLSEYAVLPPKGRFKKKFGIPEDKKIILYLGRIHKIKGIDFLVKAYANLIKKMNYKDVILVIAGPDDGYLKEVKESTAALGVWDSVMFTGFLSEKDKIGAYVDANVVVNVEPLNVYGLVPLEVAACGTPVIISKGNAIKDVVHEGKFGFSVKYGDISELAETMSKMLVNDGLQREMGRNGRKFIFENYNWANIITKLEKVYEEVVEA